LLRVSTEPKFSQETGKIQFVIPTKPQEFAGLDFYDPFFEELNVPLTLSQKSELISSDIVEEAANEFTTMLKVGLQNFFNKRYFQFDDIYKEKMSGETTHNILSNTWKNYRDLRVLGFDDISSDAFENSAIDPEYVFDLLNFSSTFFSYPILDGLHRKPVLSQKYFHLYGKKINGKYPVRDNSIRFKYEIGSFLMKKYIHYPKSFEACKQMIIHYDEHDLQKIYEALSKAILTKDLEQTIDLNGEIDHVLDSIWEETQQVKKQRKILKFEISLLLGVVGWQVGELPGLLSTLGIKLWDKGSSNILDKYSNKLAEKLMKPYIVPIVNFEDRHKINY